MQPFVLLKSWHEDSNAFLMVGGGKLEPYSWWCWCCALSVHCKNDKVSCPLGDTYKASIWYTGRAPHTLSLSYLFDWLKLRFMHCDNLILGCRHNKQIHMNTPIVIPAERYVKREMFTYATFHSGSFIIDTRVGISILLCTRITILRLLTCANDNTSVTTWMHWARKEELPSRIFSRRHGILKYPLYPK